MNAIIFASEAPNSFLLPGDINEVIWGTISFLCIVALFFWKGLAPAKAMWFGRIERIENELEQRRGRPHGRRGQARRRRVRHRQRRGRAPAHPRRGP